MKSKCDQTPSNIVSSPQLLSMLLRIVRSISWSIPTDLAKYFWLSNQNYSRNTFHRLWREFFPCTRELEVNGIVFVLHKTLSKIAREKSELKCQEDLCSSPEQTEALHNTVYQISLHLLCIVVTVTFVNFNIYQSFRNWVVDGLRFQEKWVTSWITTCKTANSQLLWGFW